MRFAAGPVALDGYAPRIANFVDSKLQEAAPGWGLSLGGVQLSWEGREQGLAVRLTDVRLREPSGATAFQAPAVAVSFDLVEALQGRAAPNALGVRGAELVLARAKNGQWRFNLSTEKVAERGADGASPGAEFGTQMLDTAEEALSADALNSREGRAGAAQLLDALTGPRPLFGALGDLQSIRVYDAGVTYLDDKSGSFLRASSARLELQLIEGGGLRLAMQALLDAEAGDRDDRAAKISLVGERLRDAREASLSLRFEDAPISAIAAQFPDLDALRAIEGYASGEAVASISLDNGDLTAFTAALRGEGAQFAALRRGAEAQQRDFGAQEAHPLSLSAFSATFDYQPEQDALALRRLQVTGDRLTADVMGSARFLRNEDGAAYGAEGSLTIASARVLDPELFETPLTIDEGMFDFRLEGGAPGSERAPLLDVTALEIATPDVSARGSAKVLLSPPVGEAANGVGGQLGLRADLSLSLSDFKATRLPAIWPLPAAPGGRDWVAENVRGGEILEGSLTALIGGGVDAAPGEDVKESIDFDFRFQDLISRYLGEMTPLQDASGVGRVTADRFDLRVEAAQVDLGEDGAIALDGSRFEITSFEPEYPPGEILVRTDGDLRALLALLDQEPLALTRKLDLDAELIKGRAKGVTRLKLPLKKDLPAEEVDVVAEGALKEFELPLSKLDGRRVQAQRAEINVNGERLSLRGDAVLEGYEKFVLDAEWTETFSPAPGEPRSVVVAETPLDAETLIALGAPSTFELAGGARLKMRIAAAQGEDPRFTAGLSFKDLAVLLPGIGWSKSRGEAGVLDAELSFDEQGAVALSRLALEAEGLSAEGEGRLDATGALRSLSIHKLKTDSGTELSVQVDVAEDGAVKVAASGPRLSLGGAVGGSTKGARSSARADDPPMSVDLEVDRLTLAEGPGLRNAKLAVRLAKNRQLRADFNARSPKGFVKATARPAGKGLARYQLDTDDLGGVLTAFGMIEQAEGGAATIKARETSAGVVKGTLEARELVVKSAPSIAELLSVASLIGIVDLASTGGITFSDISAPFVLSGSELKIDKLTAKGPSLGMTAEGTVDFGSGALDVKGDVSPAFVLNGLPGELPIIGRILTGGEGQGLIGFSFSVDGTIDDPSPNVNPLSAFAPGPLRGIFGG